MIQLFKELKDCCGCAACMNICPKKAITMRADGKGFVYPDIDQQLCIECGKCKRVCAFQNVSYNESLKGTYAAVSTNTDVRESASGGLFASFAKAVLEDNGVVYGCAMIYENEKLQPKHICVTCIEELALLKGSKYVQSDIGYIYQDVRNRLKTGVTVLFSGTPCQIAGLRGFLEKEYKNLFTIDIICHGVPSVQFFQDYISYAEKKIGKKIVDFRFRDKHSGWKLYGRMSCKNSDGTVEQCYFEPEESSYYQMFLNSYTYRENCYFCPYACDNRQGDITIGDYWCIDLVHPEMLIENGGVLDEKQGISCMIINDSRGKEMLKRYGHKVLAITSSYENAARYNAQLKKSSILKKERTKALDLYSKGYNKLERWYQRKLFFIKTQRAIIKKVPKPIKKFAKTVLKRP